MNRKKKVNETLKKRLKKQNSRLHKSNKPKYISKAERAKLEQEDALKSEQLDTIELRIEENDSTEQ